MKRFISWIFSLFDGRSDYEKQEDAKMIADIKKLGETHHIIVGKRGGIRTVKRDNHVKQR